MLAQGVRVSNKVPQESTPRNLRFLWLFPFAAKRRLALRERFPPPFSLHPALLGQELSRAPFRSFGFSSGCSRGVSGKRLRWYASAHHGSHRCALPYRGEVFIKLIFEATASKIFLNSALCTLHSALDSHCFPAVSLIINLMSSGWTLASWAARQRRISPHLVQRCIIT